MTFAVSHPIFSQIVSHVGYDDLDCVASVRVKVVLPACLYLLLTRTQV